jgi:hypothetical protein
VKRKGVSGVAQVVEHLFSKCEALNSISSTTKKIKKERMIIISSTRKKKKWKSSLAMTSNISM